MHEGLRLRRSTTQTLTLHLSHHQSIDRSIHQSINSGWGGGRGSGRGDGAVVSQAVSRGAGRVHVPGTFFGGRIMINYICRRMSGRRSAPHHLDREDAKIESAGRTHTRRNQPEHPHLTSFRHSAFVPMCEHRRRGARRWRCSSSGFPWSGRRCRCVVVYICVCVCMCVFVETWSVREGGRHTQELNTTTPHQQKRTEHHAGGAQEENARGEFAGAGGVFTRFVRLG